MNPYLKGYTICVTLSVFVAMMSTLMSAEVHIRSYLSVLESDVQSHQDAQKATERCEWCEWNSVLRDSGRSGHRPELHDWNL